MADDLTSGPTSPSTSNDAGSKANQGQAQTGGTGIGAAASDVLHSAKDAAASVTKQAEGKLGSMADEGKKSAASALDDVAEALHDSASSLEGKQDFIAGLIEKGSSELTSLASTLRTNDLQGLLGKLDDLARREPAVFVGAAMAAGFAAVRLGKVVVSNVSSDDLPKVEMPKVKETSNESN